MKLFELVELAVIQIFDAFHHPDVIDVCGTQERKKIDSSLAASKADRME